MTIESIAAAPASGLSPEALAILRGDLPPMPGVSDAVQASGSFERLVSQGLGSVNEQLLSSQVDLQALASGEAQNLHQIMMKLEESRLSFQLMMQVRARLLEAYQDVMRMQV